MTWPILSVTTFLPLVGAVLVYLVRGDDEAARRNARWIALWTTLITFAVSLILVARFDPANPGFQFAEKAPWLGATINYHMGVDGISLPLVILTTAIMPFCIIASWRSVTMRVREYMIAFLVLETLMIGTFSALDLVLFYLFFEGGLIPMFLIIGVWGGPRRVYSAFKFFLYTLTGSVTTPTQSGDTTCAYYAGPNGQGAPGLVWLPTMHKVACHPGGDSALYFLDEGEVRYLKDEVGAEYSSDLRRVTLDMLLDIFELQVDPLVRREIVGHIDALVLHLLADGVDLLQIQLAGQHHLREADVLQEACFLGRSDVGLRAGVQLDGRQVELQQPHVLHDQRVDPGVVQLPDQLAGGLEFVIAQDGVQRGEDARVVAVGVLHQPGDVADFVAGIAARAERGSADVDGIGPVVDGLDADVGGLGGGEQFDLVAGSGHGRRKEQKGTAARNPEGQGRAPNRRY